MDNKGIYIRYSGKSRKYQGERFDSSKKRKGVKKWGGIDKKEKSKI